MNKDDVKDFVDSLLPHLPPIIARHEVQRFLGGLVSPYTIKHHDLAGTGPEVAWRVGRKVAYKTESLLLWLASREGGVTRLQHLKTV